MALNLDVAFLLSVSILQHSEMEHDFEQSTTQSSQSLGAYFYENE